MSLVSWVEVDTGRFDFSRRGGIAVGSENGSSKSRRILELEADWREWARHHFHAYTSDDGGNEIPFAKHHERLWEWVWEIRRGERPKPFVAIWPRGSAKSTTAEMAVVALGALDRRSYVLYVSATQEQADDHVDNIGAMLESAEIGHSYPSLGSPKRGKFGNSKGWRRSRIRTDSGLTVDAIGLDTAARGAKVEEDRPDFLVADDLDGELDTPKTTEKKIKSLTRKLLPAGADDLAVLAVQNLVHNNSIFSRLADGRADFLADRIVDGPLPALEDFEYEVYEGRAVITSGVPTWAGMDKARCQEILDDEGLQAFLVERQQRRESLSSNFDSAWWASPRTRYDFASREYQRSVKRRFQFWDTSFEDDQAASYTACVTLDLLSDYRVAVREAWRKKMQFPELEAAIVRKSEEHNQDGLLSGVIFEKKASAHSVLQTLRITAPMWLRPLISGFTPPDSKDEKNRRAAVYSAPGLVLLPFAGREYVGPDGEWLLPFTDELWNVPDVEYRDLSDAYSLGIIRLERYLAEAYRSLHGVSLNILDAREPDEVHMTESA